MKTYVLGAGTSATAKYPLGGQLLASIDRFVRGLERHGTSNHVKDWSRFCTWSERNRNPLIAEAYRSGNLEQLFTVLDFASKLRHANLDAIWGNKDIPNTEGQVTLVARLNEWIRKWLNGGSALEQVHLRFEKKVERYLHYQKMLLWALEVYFQHRHESDLKSYHQEHWKDLRTFARKLCKGDVVITFNYDSTLERVLLEEKKWTPKDGYGFELVFQRSSSDERREEIDSSEVTVLHLHGAIGWYRKPTFKEGYIPPDPGGAISREVLTPAPIETGIALDPLFLKQLKLSYVDASLPTSPTDQYQILIHPSFLKDYELEQDSNVFIKLWKKAADALRVAEEISIIGYSLPQEDSAALTLLLGNTTSDRVKIVNSNRATNHRLEGLLSFRRFLDGRSFEDWLQTLPDCTK